MDRDRREFATANDLTVIRGPVALPHLRIEYETEDGRLEHRDVEVIPSGIRAASSAARPRPDLPATGPADPAGKVERRSIHPTWRGCDDL
jgi:hypothetical protein